jgi:hypothetical protein
VPPIAALRVSSFVCPLREAVRGRGRVKTVNLKVLRGRFALIDTRRSRCRPFSQADFEALDRSVRFDTASAEPGPTLYRRSVCHSSVRVGQKSRHRNGCFEGCNRHSTNQTGRRAIRAFTATRASPRNITAEWPVSGEIEEKQAWSQSTLSKSASGFLISRQCRRHRIP